MSESLLVTYCAPTLAGLKTGNLFNCTCTGRRQAEETVRQWNSYTQLKRRVCSDHAAAEKAECSSMYIAEQSFCMIFPAQRYVDS